MSLISHEFHGLCFWGYMIDPMAYCCSCIKFIFEGQMDRIIQEIPIAIVTFREL